MQSDHHHKDKDGSAQPSESSSSLPPFTLTKPIYDQNTFEGRFKHFLDVTDVRTLFVTKEELDAAVDLLKRFKEGKATNVSNAELWRAKKICDASIHPDTGEVIPLPFRMSAFLPMNVFICAGLLIPNPSALTLVFWQWINQSYNIALNHANRNASNPMSNQQIAISYASAVTISCGVALGLRQLVEKTKIIKSASVLRGIRLITPFTAVALAGIANVFIMRSNEMKDGIKVTDENGEVVGQSAKAGVRAVTQVAASRVLTSFPVLLLPPLILNQLTRIPFFKARPVLHTPINLALITATLFTSLPAAIATFPQYSSVDARSLETKFHNLKNAKGEPITRLYYNKGL
eukprot:TRINITY_DN8443_c0_g1_i1.p1 TRINITY_DN8443_c0_g1~~TRINITY_DN8443_c0_g1_i1.p1  ORF type:complete len:364 (-),score=72.32 TRINITY_DN8443_c0_g1_i1:47-1087(-)